MHNNAPKELLEVVIRDIDRVIAALQPLMQNNDWTENDYKNYVIYTHGMKSIMSNVGNARLSAQAKELEDFGIRRELSIIKEKTPLFLQELLAIKAMGAANTKVEKGNPEILQKNLNSLCDACRNHNKKAAKDALAALAEYSWTKEITNLIARIDEMLQHAQFDEIVKMFEGV